MTGSVTFGFSSAELEQETARQVAAAVAVASRTTVLVWLSANSRAGLGIRCGVGPERGPCQGHREFLGRQLVAGFGYPPTGALPGGTKLRVTDGSLLPGLGAGVLGAQSARHPGPFVTR